MRHLETLDLWHSKSNRQKYYTLNKIGNSDILSLKDTISICLLNFPFWTLYKDEI